MSAETARSTLRRLRPTMLSGRFVADPAVGRLSAHEVIIDGPGIYGMGDGEELGNAPLRISVAPRSLTVFGAETEAPAVKGDADPSLLPEEPSA